MKSNSSIDINLIVFDGDDTLWYGLDGGYISGVDDLDPGSDDYTFVKLNDLQIRRNDGKRFQLFPEVRGFLAELSQQHLLMSIASYNHHQPVERALAAFEIDHYFSHPVIEWSSHKDLMLKKILGNLNRERWLISSSKTLFIDDDQKNRYRIQMESIGVHFLQKGVEILNFTELLDHPSYRLSAAEKGMV